MSFRGSVPSGYSSSGYNLSTDVHRGMHIRSDEIHCGRVPYLFKLQLHLLLPAWVLLQQNEPFQYARKRNVLLSCEFRTFGSCQSYRCLIGLEARDCAWFPRLTYDVDGLESGGENEERD